MASSKPPNPGLNYYQQSPVRGQLENPDGTARSGWRYIQCTDTPNELRVLLPPHTALVYSHLLKAELAELSSDRSPNWDRIVQIRHLKDRMIRKCTRLRHAGMSKDKLASRVLFQTIQAPSDFRLKEMERWYRLQGGDLPKPPTTATEGVSTNFHEGCEQCMKDHARMQMQAQTSAGRRVPSSSRPAPPRGPTPERPARRSPGPPGQSANFSQPPARPDPRTRGAAPARGHARQQSMSAAPTHRHPPPSHPPASAPPAHARRSGELLRADHGSRAYAPSPDPIPIPYRTHAPPSPDPYGDDISSADDGGDSPPAARVLDLPMSSSPVPAPSPTPSNTPPKVSSPPNGLPTIHEDQEHEHRPIVRRRSSLKKRDSLSRISVASQSKSVAWAMDRDWVDQMSKYIKTSNEAEVLSAELDKLRLEYHDDVEAMRALCLQLEQSQERVRMETDALRQKEHAVKLQENKILTSSEHLEVKQAELQAKVLAVLEESKRIVQLCDKKREIHEST